MPHRSVYVHVLIAACIVANGLPWHAGGRTQRFADADGGAHVAICAAAAHHVLAVRLKDAGPTGVPHAVTSDKQPFRPAIIPTLGAPTDARVHLHTGGTHLPLASRPPPLN